MSATKDTPSTSAQLLPKILHNCYTFLSRESTSHIDPISSAVSLFPPCRQSTLTLRNEECHRKVQAISADIIPEQQVLNLVFACESSAKLLIKLSTPVGISYHTRTQHNQSHEQHQQHNPVEKVLSSIDVLVPLLQTRYSPACKAPASIST
jgi:hypothetical protein